jgi:hypothetical protein
MAQRVELEVTVPVHGPGGEVVWQPGHRFGSLEEVPDGVPVRPVFADVPDEPAEPAPEPPTAPAPELKATARAAKAAAP